MAENLSEIYLDFLDIWQEAGGVLPRNRKLGTPEGGAFVEAVEAVGMDALRLAVADADDRRHLLIWLRGMAKGLTEIAAPIEPEVAASPPLVDPALGDAAFSEIMGFWVANRNYPEAETASRAAFRAAVPRYSAAVILSAARKYTDALLTGRAGAHPYHLSNFLKSENFIGWSERVEAEARATPEDREEFAMAHATYPPYPEKERSAVEAWEAYWQWIKPEDRDDFLLACEAFRDKRDPGFGHPDPDGEIQYTQKFAKFVFNWRPYSRSSRDLPDCVAEGIRIAAAAAGSPLESSLVNSGGSDLSPLQSWSWFMSNKCPTMAATIVRIVHAMATFTDGYSGDYLDPNPGPGIDPAKESEISAAAIVEARKLLRMSPRGRVARLAAAAA